LEGGRNENLDYQQEVVVMKRENKKGLCETCIRKDECTYLNTNSEPVLFCEEFATGCNPVRETVDTISRGPDYDEGYEGLCKNCDNRKMCTVCKKGSPVWQCEEYA